MTGSIETITPDREWLEAIARLRERPYSKATWGPVLICSVVLHVVLLSFILFRPMTAATKLTFGTYYTVELVRSTELSGPSSYRDAFAEEMKDLLSEKQGLVPRKKSAVREQPPIKRLDARGKTPQEVSRAIEALKNKTAHATQSVPTSGVAEGGNVSPEADALNAYYGVIWAEIKAKWAFPGGLASGRDLIAVVHVRVMKNGMAEDIVLQQRSANAVFNESVIKAVKKASPFPPFPAGLRESMMELGIRFHSSQLGTK